MPHATAPAHRTSTWSIAQWTLAGVAVLAALALAVGWRQGQAQQAGLVAAACLGGAAAAVWRVRSSALCHALLAAAAVLLVLASLHWLPPQPQWQYLPLLVMTMTPSLRDWRLVVAAATAFGGHHVWRAQATPGLVLDAPLLATLVLQCAYLASVTWRLARAERHQFEVGFLVHAMGKEGPIRLNLDVLRAESSVGRRLRHVQQRMTAAMRQVRESTDGVSSAAEVLAAGSEELSSRTGVTANGLREAAMSLEQINVIVQSSAKAALEARTMAEQATALARHGGEQVGQVVQTMQDIHQASRRITDITTVIDGIAFQTNILALNAAVEAARAGEQGRGFAVVAAEVRSLALRASSAAREIKQLIGTAMDTVEAGSQRVQSAGSTMDEVVGAVQRVNEVFTVLSADTDEHAGGIAVITQSVRDLDEVTQRNIAVAQSSDRIAGELREHALKLNEVLSAFKLGGQPAAPVPPQRSAPAAPVPAAPAPKVAAVAPPRASRPAAAPTPGGPAADNVEFF